MYDRRVPPWYGDDEYFDDEEWEINDRLLAPHGSDATVVPRHSLLHENLLQRFTERGRWFPDSLDDFYDVPEAPRGPGSETSFDRSRRHREERHLENVLEASAREEREAQIRRDAQEAARLDALERQVAEQVAEDYAYAQALQDETSSDSGDSSIVNLRDHIWQPQPATTNGRSSTMNKKSSSTATSGRPTPQTFNCAACFNSFEYPNSIALLSCGHYYCTECLSGLFSGAISGAISRLNPQPFPPSCCNGHPIVYDVVERWLSAQVRRTYIRHRALLETPMEERVWCARDNCGKFIAPQRSTVTTGIFGSRFADGNRLPSTSGALKSNTLVSCTTCSTQTCTKCKRPAEEHTGGAAGVCPEDANIKKLMSTAQKRGWKQCYRCNSMVEKSSGCNHMTCTCGAQFCYVCGQRWQGRHCDHGM